jgi:hypothetical protein
MRVTSFIERDGYRPGDARSDTGQYNTALGRVPRCAEMQDDLARSVPNEKGASLQSPVGNGRCPVGAISPDGDFNFSACYTHNYREFSGA